MLLQHLQAWDRPSIFSLEIVERTYGNHDYCFHINFFKILMLLQHLQAWDGPSIFSLEIVERAYGNKNCGEFFLPTASARGIGSYIYAKLLTFCCILYSYLRVMA